jgi:hypothetical protein
MTGRRWRRGSIASLTFAATLVALVGAGGGCEIAIGSAVPEFECESNKAAVCPGDQVCDPNQHVCVEPCSATSCKAGFTCDPNSNICIVAPSDDGPVVDEPTTGDEPDADASTQPDEAAPPIDTGTEEAAGPCRGTGCACTSGASCDSQICGDSSLVPQAILTMAGFAFCTKPCCTSADCDLGTVCFATGGSSSVAANFCVEPQWIGRSGGVGAATGGTSCGTGRDCKSGLCASSKCADTCCSTAQSSSECASGTSCRFASFPGATSVDQNFVAWCGQAGGGQNGDNCNNNSSCASNLCDGIDGCANACRNTGDCTNGESCAYVNPPAPNDTAVVAACFSGAGNTSMGASCSSDTDCKSQFCDTGGTHECTDVCFTNADCAAKSGWRCRPESVTLQSGGKVEVLACGP